MKQVLTLVDQIVLAINEYAGHQYATADDITITRDTLDDFRRIHEFLELWETDHGDLHIFIKDTGPYNKVFILDGGEHRAVMNE